MMQITGLAKQTMHQREIPGQVLGSMLDKMAEKSKETNDGNSTSMKGITNHIKMRLGITSRQSITTYTNN